MSNAKMQAIRDLVEPMMDPIYWAVVSAREQAYDGLPGPICKEAYQDYKSQMGVQTAYLMRRELYQRLPGSPKWVTRQGMNLILCDKAGVMFRAGTARPRGSISNEPQAGKKDRAALRSFMRRDKTLFSNTDAQPAFIGALAVDADLSLSRVVVPVYDGTRFVDAWEILPEEVATMEGFRRQRSAGEQLVLTMKPLRAKTLFG